MFSFKEASLGSALRHLNETLEQCSAIQLFGLNGWDPFKPLISTLCCFPQGAKSSCLIGCELFKTILSAPHHTNQFDLGVGDAANTHFYPLLPKLPIILLIGLSPLCSCHFTNIGERSKAEGEGKSEQTLASCACLFMVVVIFSTI